MRVRTTAASLALLLALGSASAAERAPWVRVPHPDFPFSFEAPDDSALYATSHFSLGHPRMRTRERMEFTLLGVRPLPGPPARRAALQVAFFWITSEALGAEPAALHRLARAEPGREEVESFVRGVFYRGVPVDLEDRGGERLAGFAARRFGVRWRAAPGTSAERAVEGEGVVIPVSPLASLVVIGRFDAGATADDRQSTFPRILRSLEMEPGVRTRSFRPNGGQGPPGLAGSRARAAARDPHSARPGRAARRAPSRLAGTARDFVHA